MDYKKSCVCVFTTRFPFVFCTALAYKGIDYEYRAVNLVKDGGEQVLFKFGFCALSSFI